MNKDKLIDILKSFESEAESIDGLTKEMKEVRNALIDSNEELIATFVEGTKRLIKKEGKDITPQLKELIKAVKDSGDDVKKELSKVEEKVGNIKMPSNVDFRATGSMLKFPIKQLTKTIKEAKIEFPKTAKEAIPVRLSDGEKFYNALENFIQQIGGGGGATSYAFDKQDSSPTKAATVATTISGKSRDVLAVVNPDGSNVGAASSVSITDIEDGAGDSVMDATNDAIKISIVNDDVGIGGGTQYTEGDTDASITGNAMMMEVAANTLQPVQGTVADGLLVNLGSNNDVTGTVTANLGATDNAVLDSIDTSTQGILADTAAIQTAVELIDNAISGTEMQVDVVASLPAGTNAIGKLAANSGVDIGDVDILSLPSDTFVAEAGSLGKGVLLQGDDGTDRKNVNVDATTGDVQVDVTNTVTVDATGSGDVPITLAGEAVVLGAGSASIGTLGANSGTDIGDVTINNASGASAVNIQDGGNTITVDGSLTSAGNVTNAGTFVVQEDGAALTALQLIDDAIYVDDADWTANTSKHALVGAVTQATPSANTDGDTTPLITNSLRELRTAALESDLAAASTSHVHKYYTSATPTDGIIWSPAAGKRWYLTHLSINVSAASTVTIEDDKAGGDDPVYKAEFAANSGVVLTFPDVPLFSGEDAADLTVTASAGTVYVTAVGYEI